MRCDILIRSYWKDFSWLALCLAAIHRHCVGFGEVILVVPRSSHSRLSRLVVPDMPLRIASCADYRDDYLGQQVTKLTADEFTDAEFICHVDADCIFARPTAPADLITDGRSRIVRRAFAGLGRHWPWQAPTEAFIGEPVSHDFMQQPPFVYPRWLFAAARAHAVTRHGVELERYVLGRAPRGFSEFNALGALAWTRHRDRFDWCDADAIDPGPPACRWYWSWGGLDPATEREIRASLEPVER